MQEVSESEIDLGELFSVLLGGWKIVIIFILVSAVSSIYYALNFPIEKFESVATVQLSGANNSPQFSNLGGLASLAGISVAGGSTDQIKLQTRLDSRKFILGLNEEVGLRSDSYFNPYFNQTTEAEDNINLKDLKSFVFALLKSERTLAVELDGSIDLNPKIEYEIVKNFRSNLRIDELDGGALKVYFKHTSPIRAAEILNSALTKAINQMDMEKKEAARVRLNYLEGELTGIQKELEAAVDAMQKYAVESNLGSIQDLASSSFRTDSLRDELKILLNTQTAIDFLSSSDNFTKEFLGDVRIKFPFIGTLDFRSRLNLSANISDWTKPSDIEFELAQARVLTQIEDLSALISDLEKKARSTAEEAKIYSELQRNVKVQETLYEVVIKQFESQSISSGLRGKSVEFFESGVPPINKVEPRRPLIVLLSVIFGAFLGSVLVLVRAAVSGVIHSKRVLVVKCKKFGAILWLSDVKTTCGQNFVKSFQFIHSKIQKYRNLVSFVAPSQLIFGVVSSHSDGNARFLALVVAQAMLKFSSRIQLVDLHGLFKLPDVTEKNIDFLGPVNSHMLNQQCEVLQFCSDLNSYDLLAHIEKMKQDGKAVILLFQNLEVEQNELTILAPSLDSVFCGVRVKKTTKNQLFVMESIFLKSENPGAIVYC